MLSIFSWACSPSVYLFWKNAYSGLLLIFKIELLFYIELYELFMFWVFVVMSILGISLLSVILFANVFI